MHVCSCTYIDLSLRQITQAKQWGALSAQLGLPEMASAPNNPNPMPVASMLQQYYGAVLGLLEEWYLKQQHQKQLRSQQPVPDGSSSFLPPGAQPGPSRIAVGPGEAYSVDGGIRRKILESLPEKRTRLGLLSGFRNYTNVFSPIPYQAKRQQQYTSHPEK
jgi:hypothetical protein